MTEHRSDAQGEIWFRRIDTLPADLAPATIGKTSAGDWIISQSEKGNHHVIDGGCTVLERVKDVPKGMTILYAIVENPSALRQDAGIAAHGSHDLAPGIYEMRIKRERQPFTDQSRRVAD